jgi:hypothetical protein
LPTTSYCTLLRYHIKSRANPERDEPRSSYGRI